MSRPGERPRGKGHRDQIEPEIDERQEREPEQHVDGGGTSTPSPRERGRGGEVREEGQDGDPDGGRGRPVTPDRAIGRRFQRHRGDGEVPVGGRGRRRDPLGVKHLDVGHGTPSGTEDHECEDRDADDHQQGRQCGSARSDAARVGRTVGHGPQP